MDEFNMIKFLDEIKENLEYIFTTDVGYTINSDLEVQFAIMHNEYPYIIRIPLSDITKDISEIANYEESQIQIPLLINSYSSKIAMSVIRACLKKFRGD